jgi:predicted PurR-regulated permease PerM
MSENGLDVRTRLFSAALLGAVGAMTGVAVVTAIIIGALYFGRELFVLIALAILLSFVLAPLVRALQRWYVPRGLSVVSIVLLAFMSIFALGGVIAAQVTELAGDLPRYQITIREKIKSLRGAAATSWNARPTSCRTSARSSTNRRAPRRPQPPRSSRCPRGRKSSRSRSRCASLLPRRSRASRR